MLHETAARAEEVLSLDLDELDLRNRRAKVRRKGGAATIVVWRTQTARLPPRRRGRGGHLGAAGDFWAHLIPL
jgi:integrase